MGPIHRPTKSPRLLPWAFCWCEKRDLNPYGVNHTPLKRARLPVPPLSHIKTPLFCYSKKVSEEIYRGHAPQTVRFRKLRLLIEVLRTVGLRSAVATRLISHYSNTFILLLEEGLRGGIATTCREHMVLYTIKIDLSIPF